VFFLLEEDKMTFPSLKIYLGELNNTPLGNLRIAVTDLGLIAVDLNSSWIDIYFVLKGQLNQTRKRSNFTRKN
jgi:hypothetical protein